MKFELFNISLNHWRRYKVEFFILHPSRGRERVSLGFTYSLFSFSFIIPDKHVCIEILFFFRLHFIKGSFCSFEWKKPKRVWRVYNYLFNKSKKTTYCIKDGEFVIYQPKE